MTGTEAKNTFFDGDVPNVYVAASCGRARTSCVCRRHSCCYSGSMLRATHRIHQNSPREAWRRGERDPTITVPPRTCVRTCSICKRLHVGAPRFSYSSSEQPNRIFQPLPKSARQSAQQNKINVRNPTFASELESFIPAEAE